MSNPPQRLCSIWFLVFGLRNEYKFRVYTLKVSFSKFLDYFFNPFIPELFGDDSEENKTTMEFF